MNRSNTTAAPFICNVRADYIFHAAKARSDDPCLDALYGIRIEPLPNGQGVYIVACNGHQLIMLRDVNGSASRPGTIYPDKSFLQAIERGAASRLCVTAKAVGELARPDGMTVRQEAFTHDRHEYPDFRNFIALAQKARPVPLLALPAHQLAGMACGTKAQKRGNFVLYGTGEESPIFIRDTDFEDFLGIIMPIRFKGEVAQAFAAPVPAWAEELAPWAAPAVNVEEEAATAEVQAPAQPNAEPTATPITPPALSEESPLPAAPLRLRDIAAMLEAGEVPAPVEAAPEAPRAPVVTAPPAPVYTPAPAAPKPRRIRGNATTAAKPVAAAPAAPEVPPAPVSLPEVITAPTDAPERPHSPAHYFGLVIAPAYLAHFVRTPAA